MIICYIDISSVSIFPLENNAVLIVNPHAIITGHLPFKHFQSVSRRNAKLLEIVSGI